MFFREVIGQDSIKRKLIESVRAGRISHAQLFSGESGTGVLPLALAYAQYINCLRKGEYDSCGECEACRKGNEYPDLHFSFPVINKKPGSKPVSDDFIHEWRTTLKESAYLDYNDWMQVIGAENKQGNITAEECRQIIRKLSLKPLYEGYKIMIIWLPEYMGAQGNILLKILEEPPEKTLFLLVAEDEEQILQTILSRTQILRVPRIEDGDLIQALKTRDGLHDEEAERISRLSEGNYITAHKLVKEVENNYTDEFINWMRLCFKPEMAGVLKWVDGMASTGRENQKHFLLNGLRLLRECLLAGNSLGVLNRYLSSEKDFVEKFSGFMSYDNIVLLNDEFSKGHYYIERNVNPKILFFNLSLKIVDLFRRRRMQARA